MRAFRTERLLARMFFRRFFESELLPPGLPQVQLVIWGIALLAGPSYLRAVLNGLKYEDIARWRPAALPEAMRADAFFFVTFAMLGLAVVALIVWEGLFPDRRDARTLGVLPLRTQTLIIARLSALAALAGLFCLGANLPAALLYGPVVGAYDPDAGPFRTAAAHLVVTSMGGLFVFFLVIGAQGLLLCLVGRQAARRLALALQVLLVVGFIQMFLLLPFLSRSVSSAFGGHGPSWVAVLPSAWFLALYEIAGGTARRAPAAYAVLATFSTVAVIGASIALFAASYRRLVRQALETPHEAGARPGIWRHDVRPGAVRPRLVAALLSHPVQRAVAGFTLRTVLRSRAHMMLLMTHVGIAAALALTTVLPLLVARGLDAFGSPAVAWLSAPLILNFFALCGMRTVLALPVEIKANWIFRLHAPDHALFHVVSGVRAAFLLAVVAPVGLAAGTAGALLWGVRAGLTIGLVTGALGVLLTDLLLIGLRKVPFACTYYPGRSRARTLWPLYVMAFSTYAFALASLEAAALTRPWLVAMILIAVALVSLGLRSLRQRILRPPPGLTYEETDPDGAFQGFGLSEGLAAAAAQGARGAAEAHVS